MRCTSHNIMRTLWIIPTLFLAVLVSFPHSVFAATIVQQTVFTDLSNHNYSAGNGLSGTPVSAALKLKNGGGGASCTFYVEIAGFLGAYFTQMQLFDSQNVTVSSTAQGDYVVEFAGAPAMNPIWYYTVTVGVSSGSCTASNSIYGAPGTTGQYFIVSDTDLFDSSTRIDTVTPADGVTVATSTGLTLGATGYVNPVDYSDGMVLRLNISYNYATGYNPQTKTPLFQPSSCPSNFAQNIVSWAGGNAPAIFCEWSPNGPTAARQDFPITSSGAFSVSTTTPILNLGRYSTTYSIVKPLVSILGINLGENTLLATSTRFVASTTSYYDKAQDQLDTIISTVQSTTSAAVLNTCNPLSGAFNAGTCAYGLVVPNSSDLQTVWDKFQQFVLYKFPWGYATRLVAILSTTAATTTDPITIVMPATTALAGYTYTVDPIGELSVATADLNGITNPYTGHGVKDVAEPFVQFFVALSVLIIVFHDVMAMGHSSLSSSRHHRT